MGGIVVWIRADYVFSTFLSIRLQAVGITLRSLIHSVDEILPSLHSSVCTEVG